MKLQNECPKYIARDYPKQASNWPQFVREAEGFAALAASDLSAIDKWKACCDWWQSWQAPVNESHSGSTSTFYKVPALFPWAIFGRSTGTLQRSVYISMETSDCDVKTGAEMLQD